MGKIIRNGIVISPLNVSLMGAKLNAPILVKGITTFTLTNPSSNGNYPIGYKIYIDGKLYKTVEKDFTAGENITLSFVDDMSLFVGTHTLKAILFGEKVVQSEFSNEITFKIFTISQTLENITSDNDTQYIYENDSYSNTLTPATDYFLPSKIVLTMAGINIVASNYNDYVGKISIEAVSGNIIIEASGDTVNKLRTPWIILKEKELNIRTVKNANKYVVYMNGTQVYEQEVTLPTYTVEQVSEVETQQFALNEKNYYESKCQKVSSGWSLCKLVFSGSGSCILHCISNGESSYDYGIIGNINQTLASSNVDDGATGSTKVKHNFKGESSTQVKDVVFDSISNGDFIMCKYKKDGSGDQGFDSLQFQVEVDF